MNKVRREYCSKGKHPHWRAWAAKYDMSTSQAPFNWSWTGNFCTFCGARVSGVAGGVPYQSEAVRLKVLRNTTISQADIEAARARTNKLREKREELKRRIQARKCSAVHDREGNATG